MKSTSISYSIYLALSFLRNIIIKEIWIVDIRSILYEYVLVCIIF